MLFTSYEYIFVFLPAVFLIYQLLRRSGPDDAPLVWLILASLFFYGWWNPVYVPLLIITILVNFSVGRYVMSQPVWRKPVLVVGIAFNLALLGYFKYANFFVGDVNAAFGLSFNLGTIILPLAISFFTFQQVAYLVDAYHGHVRDRSFLRYALFVTFFPQLIAGPIVHHSEMMPQYADSLRQPFSWEQAAVGVSIFSIGLFKKVVIADGLAPVASAAFGAADSGQALSFLVAWSGTLAYTFQLYFDFSGYSDIAIGSAMLFGIVLPVNFRSPYRALNIIDFWRRWHITLSRFLRDYLYFPLGGNRKGAFRRYINLFVTMVLGGLWHGAAWTFVIWGAIHGIYLMINQWFRHVMAGNPKFSVPALLSGTVTFIAVVVAWVFFRAETLTGAGAILKAMVGAGGLGDTSLPIQQMPSPVLDGGLLSWGQLIAQGLDPVRFIMLLATAFAVALLLPNTARYYLEQEGRVRFRANFANLALIVGCWVFIFVSLGGRSEFLYFQF